MTLELITWVDRYLLHRISLGRTDGGFNEIAKLHRLTLRLQNLTAPNCSFESGRAHLSFWRSPSHS